MRLSHERAVSLYFLYPDLPCVTKLLWLSAEGPYLMQSTGLILKRVRPVRAATPRSSKRVRVLADGRGLAGRIGGYWACPVASRGPRSA